MKAKSSFEEERLGYLLSYLEFDADPKSKTSGEIAFGAYSYDNDSFGEGEINEEETRQLFLAMLNYYFATGDKVMVDVRNLLGSTHHVSGN